MYSLKRFVPGILRGFLTVKCDIQMNSIQIAQSFVNSDLSYTVTYAGPQTSIEAGVNQLLQRHENISVSLKNVLRPPKYTANRMIIYAIWLYHYSVLF